MILLTVVPPGGSMTFLISCSIPSLLLIPTLASPSVNNITDATLAFSPVLLTICFIPNGNICQNDTAMQSSIMAAL